MKLCRRAVRKLVLSSVLSVAAIATPGLAEAKTAPTVRFTADFSDRGSIPYGVYACGPTQPGVCDFKVDGTAYFTAPLTTFVDYYGYMHYNPVTRKVEAESWDRHTGTLAGCGDGTFVIHQTSVEGDPTTYDPVSGTFRMTLKWEVVRGSGTGDFTDATGSGTGYGDFEFSTANSGEYTGQITCPRGKRARG